MGGLIGSGLSHVYESAILHSMTKRLQVLFDDAEMRELRRAARSRRMTVAEWVRQALRAARAELAGTSAGDKLNAVEAAIAHAFPTGDMEQILGEIERGYVAERRE